MWMEPDIERLSRLNLTEAKIGNSILFCPECTFQIVQAAMKPICPDCNYKPLHITTVDQELFDINKMKEEVRNGKLNTTTSRCCG